MAAAEPVVAAAAAPATRTTERVVAANEPVVSATDAPAAPALAEASPAAPADATPTGTRAAAAKTTTAPTEATVSHRSRDTSPAATMRGGAEPSPDVDGPRVVAEGGLGSSTVVRRDGEALGAARVDVETTTSGGPASVVRPPTAAPPVIVAAGDPPSVPHSAPARVAGDPPRVSRAALPAVASTPVKAAGLRPLNGRTAGPLLAPVAPRSLTSGARRDAPPARRAPGEPPAATAGTGVAGTFSPPPPGGAFALLAATLAAAAAIFSILVTRPVRSGPVPFISLLERPG